MVSTSFPGLSAGLERLRGLSIDEDFRMRKDIWETFQRDQRADKYYARKEGREEGIFEIVKNLLKIGVPIEQVVKATSLTEQQIQEIQAE